MERKGQQPDKARDRKEGLGDVVKGQSGRCGEGSDWAIQLRVSVLFEADSVRTFTHAV